MSGCAQKTLYVKGLSNISQDVSLYTHNINRGYISSLESYENMYFHPWNINSMDIPLENAMWAYKIFTSKNSYGENLQPINDDFFRKIKENSNSKKNNPRGYKNISQKNKN